MHHLSVSISVPSVARVRTSVLLSRHGSRDATRRNRRDGSLRSLLMTTIIIRKSTFPSWMSLRRYRRSRSPRCRSHNRAFWLILIRASLFGVDAAFGLTLESFLVVYRHGFQESRIHQMGDIISMFEYASVNRSI